MFKKTIYNGREFTIPSAGGGDSVCFDSMLTEVPDDDHAMAFLMQDGNLYVPCGRYGRDTESCAPIALAIAKIMQEATGESMTYYGLDSDMGMVVNGSDCVGLTLNRDGYMLGDDFTLSDYLDDDEIIAAREYEIACYGED